MYMIAYPKVGNLVNDSKCLYTLQNDDTQLIKIMEKDTIEASSEMIKISQGHKNICALKKCEYDGITYNIYMEKLNGYDLFEYMYKIKLDSLKIKDIMKQILEGLNYLHNNGIIHCDIKLENIFVCSDDTVKIIDFDLSRWIDKPSIKCGGSYPYISPEALLKSMNLPITEKMDIWSLGILLYILVERKYPIVSNFDKSDCRNIICEKYYYIKNNEDIDSYNFEKIMDINYRVWDPVLLVMIKKMLIFNSNKRSSANELLDILN